MTSKVNQFPVSETVPLRRTKKFCYDFPWPDASSISRNSAREDACSTDLDVVCHVRVSLVGHGIQRTSGKWKLPVAPKIFRSSFDFASG